jgi:type 1 glutamine amidotransferase
VYQIDGEEIDPNGNILFVSDKDFGMGATHPVAWSRNVGQGQTFYTSLGHNAAAITNEPVVQLLENAVTWMVKE